MISVVIETWNLGARVEQPLADVLSRLAPQLAGAELIVTHAGLDPDVRARLDRISDALAAIRWLDVGDAGYYEHKNRGFDAATGDIVAFLDGDCTPVAGWLAAIAAPFATGARVVAGATSYPGPLAALANAIDFPYFDGRDARRVAIADAPPTVRNFFANNVAFAREVFAARRYPAIEPMFHGQCQVLGLQLLADGIEVHFAPAARVSHAWPDGVAEHLEVRLLRGADTVSLLPYVLATYAPRTAAPARRLGALPVLGLFGVRAALATWSALRDGPRLAGLGLVAYMTILDAIGAAARPLVYRRYGVAR
ncbi:MAG TPA: glycosyltransferase family 2 protein [Kofleriaceae bacterium]|nr:glycosyltransferase family 2 protein [Kofleriaceae bacterium]